MGRENSVGQVFFAIAMAGLGVLGLVRGDFASVWQPVPKWVAGRELLAYVCGLTSLAGGIGLLRETTRLAAARLLCAYLLLWLLLLRVPAVVAAPLSEVSWSGCGENTMMLAGALVIYARVASRWDRRIFGFAISDAGLRRTQRLYGLSLLPCGLAHLTYLKATADLVPRWLPWHTGWAVLTGAAYLLAGSSIIAGKWAPLASTLTAVMTVVFTASIWVPAVLASPQDGFQWTALLISSAITAGAWVMAESFRRAKAPQPSE